MQESTENTETREASAPTAGLLDPLEVQRWESEDVDPRDLDLREEIIRLNRVAKVVKGGRRFSFAATVVVGNGQGIVGIGKGKAKQVPDAIGKAVENAKRNLMRVTRVGHTIPHEVVGEFCSARVLLRPASEGTGITAGSAVRAVMELAGIHNCLTKSLGSSNVVNVVKATFEALKQLGNAERVARSRGKETGELVTAKYRRNLHERMRECMPKSPEKADSLAQAVEAANEAGREQMGAEGAGEGEDKE